MHSANLIATVGSSPLPVVVAVRALEPKRLFLLYTSDVQTVTDRINERLEKNIPEIYPIEIKDHRQVNGIRKELECLPLTKAQWQEAHLHYTGGTKLMAVHVHAYWKEKGGQARNASYLGADGRLYFDDGAVRQEHDLCSLTLDEQCSVHLGMTPHYRANLHRADDYPASARAIHRFVCENGWTEYRSLLSNRGDLASNLQVNATFTENRKFLEGDWLEIWLADNLQGMRSGEDPFFDSVEQSVKVDREPDFEIDVVATRGFRVYLFSCTAKSADKDVKQKLFEAANRAARIGGDHARAAVVCLSDDPARVLRTVQEEHWPGYDNLRLFGNDHVRGAAAPCQVSIGKLGPQTTLEDGIRDWVSRS